MAFPRSLDYNLKLAQMAPTPKRGQEIILTLVAAAGMVGLAVFLSSQLPASEPQPTPQISPSTNAVSSAKRIGILPGHWQYDGGATCDRIIFEADLTLQIAEKMVPLLEEQGYTVNLLPEKGEDLRGYQADVFLALHIDSCGYGLSGFKVAHSDESFIPEIEDRLVECIYAEYEKATGLPRHETTISHNMLKYYALHEEQGGIAPNTPGAIIELGFMDGDFDLLQNQQDVVAQGLVNGLLCFLQARA